MKAAGNKKKIVKTAVIGVLIAAASAGALFGVWKFSRSRLVAKVVPVENIMTEYEGASMESSGMITDDSSQVIYLSGENALQEVYVSVGQQVEKGTSLFSYNVDHIRADVEQKQLDIQQMENDIAIARVRLQKLRDAKPAVAQEPEEPKGFEPGGPQKEKDAYRYLLKNTNAHAGKGKKSDPYLFLCTYDCYATADFINQMRAKGWYCTFEIRKGNVLSGEVLRSVTLNGAHLAEAAADECYSIRTGELYIPQDGTQDETPRYTLKEWREEVHEAEQELSDMQFSLRRANVELRQLQRGFTDAVVKAEVSGVVTKIAEGEEMEEDGAFMVISGSDGLYVEGQISEWYLDKIREGQTVHGTDWTTGTEFSATIISVDSDPLSAYEAQTDMMGSGNASYYTYRARIDDTTGLENGDDVDLKIELDSEKEGIFIEKAFVKEENGECFIYKMDKNRRLKKQKVTVGRTAWDSYIEVFGALESEDYLAFPYAKTAKAGAGCKETDYIE